MPIERGPLQKQVWTFAKQFAKEMEAKHPKLITAEYKVAKRPAGRVLVDYNQNAWGRTLASVYSVRPRPKATVSAPVTWDEVVAGFRIGDFHMRNMPDRVRERGDLYQPMLPAEGRVQLEKFLKWSLPISFDYPVMEAATAGKIPVGDLWQYEPSGMASAASLFATAMRSNCARSRISRWRVTSPNL